MTEYRAYFLGPDGHIHRRVDLICDNEEEARQRAKQLVDGLDVELWQGTRRIAQFSHKREASG